MTLILPYVPVVKRSCCCSLRTGSVCLGWLGMISSVFRFVLIILLAVSMSRSYDIERSYSSNAAEELGTSMVSDPLKWIQSDEYYGIMTLCVFGIMVTIETIFVIMLLHGIHREKPSLMQPYLLFTIFALVSSMIGNIIGAIYVSIYDIYVGLIGIVITFLAWILLQYFWSILYSHYRELEERKGENFKYDNFDDNIKKVIL